MSWRKKIVLRSFCFLLRVHIQQRCPLEKWTKIAEAPFHAKFAHKSKCAISQCNERKKYTQKIHQQRLHFNIQITILRMFSCSIPNSIRLFVCFLFFCLFSLCDKFRLAEIFLSIFGIVFSHFAFWFSRLFADCTFAKNDCANDASRISDCQYLLAPFDLSEL